MKTNQSHIQFPNFAILGIPITATNLKDVVPAIVQFAEENRPHAVFVREVASLMAAFESKYLLSLHFKASLVVPDGMPLVWAGRLKGFGKTIGRVAGADLVDAVCAASLRTGQSHFFYGGAPGVAEEMSRRLSFKYPGLRVVGCLTPPMREIEDDFSLTEDIRAEIETIKAADANFVWIGISSPKQERWMMAVMPFIGHGVFLGVGAAFNFHSGSVTRAPKWMRNIGLEWLHRLYSEPRRLWRRYLITAPKFIIFAVLETLGIKIQSSKLNG